MVPEGMVKGTDTDVGLADITSIGSTIWLDCVGGAGVGCAGAGGVGAVGASGGISVTVELVEIPAALAVIVMFC